MYRGGPAAYPDDPSARFETLEASTPNVRIARSLSERTFRVTCAAIGDTTLTLRVGNNATKSNPTPRVETLTVPFSCAHPVSMSVWMARADDPTMQVS